LADSQWFFECVVTVASNEVLKKQLGVSEVTCVILETLTMGAHQSLLQVSGVPDPLFHLFTLEKVLAFLDQLVGTHLNVLVKQVAAEHLLPVLVIDLIRHHE